MDEEMRNAIRRGDCELIPQDRPEADVQCQINEISSKAGHTTKYGECPRATKIMSKPANDNYRKNYKRIFRHD